MGFLARVAGSEASFFWADLVMMVLMLEVEFGCRKMFLMMCSLEQKAEGA